MEDKETQQLEDFLKNASLEDLELYISEGNATGTTLSDFLNEYIGEHNLVLADVIRASLMSRDYAYSIFNGNRKNPTRDRVIAICLACHMNITQTQRALKLCNAGVLYAKNNRDAAITICINREVYDITKVNEFLFDHGMEVLKTSKDA